MDYASFFKGVAVAGFVIATLAHCSYSSEIRALKGENRSLVDQNIRLQQSQLSSRDNMPDSRQEDSSDGATPKVREELQVQDGKLSISTFPGEGEKYCTVINFDGQELMDECQMRQSRFTLLSAQSFGRVVFREEWQHEDEGEGSGSGVTLWSIHDQELVQHVSLVTARTLRTCEPVSGHEGCRRGERWIRASLAISDSEKPVLQYRYLTDTGATGEVSYAWDGSSFRLTGKDIASDIAVEYGL